MNEILNQYKVSFSIKTFFNQNFKSMHTINDMLTVYIMDHNTPLQANLLINEINEVLQETKILGGWDTQSLYFCRITPDKTQIYSDLESWKENNNIEPDFVLPTSDFKSIVEAWRDYLS